MFGSSPSLPFVDEDVVEVGAAGEATSKQAEVLNAGPAGALVGASPRASLVVGILHHVTGGEEAEERRQGGVQAGGGSLAAGDEGHQSGGQIWIGSSAQDGGGRGPLERGEGGGG